LNEKENYFSFVNQSTSNVNTNKTPLDRSQNVDKPSKKVIEKRDKQNDLLNKSTPSIRKTDIYTK